MAADEEAEVVGVQRRADDPLVLLDLHLGIERERLVHPLEQVADAIGGGLAHRRRPDRFFFLRGGAGGGPLLPLRGLAPPSAPPPTAGRRRAPLRAGGRA